ncbi:hypothetical protein BDR03DRAFT_1011080 [Suillus americanus]|nr:hypothetical protein BDR03DRAFT_1011080 [Suillus americanus]
MVLGVLSAASKKIIAQEEHDNLICSLLKKLAEVYHFITKDDSLVEIKSMCGTIWRQRAFGETWQNVISETDNIIKQYCDTLDILMQQFWDQTDWDVIPWILGQILGMAEPLPFGSLNTMVEATKAHPSSVAQWTHISPSNPFMHPSKSSSQTNNPAETFVEATKAQHHDLALALL